MAEEDCGVLGRSDDSGRYCNLHGSDYSAAVVCTVTDNLETNQVIKTCRRSPGKGGEGYPVRGIDGWDGY